ncbi:uncharacterized protein TRAVEDRAFT_42653 [Trametes versicolor FP-101664 SS1]|uniref:uncharacterized protein n=1 Tax=Trametes versicolor (strain FP-101664) TaxID=717944 RepID=UPI0004622A8D|nr:uncharacterized protein TRAVEDRAFT_42653 [Trametes versicolor FP-101664 SS1]EIW65274.1 hypothetical protein TRAVEDRAFT_42653 [Trametes versicolor FP-101664 SS1]
MTFSTASLSSAYEDGGDRFDQQADVDEAYLPANYHGTEYRHADASELCQDWWPHPGLTFTSMDLLQASELPPHPLDARHEYSFDENKASTQLQQFPPCAVAAPAGGAMSTQADASDGLNAAMGASTIAIASQLETSAWHAPLDALSQDALSQCNIQTRDNERAAKRRRKQSNPTTFVCSDCPGKTWTRLYNLNVHIRNVHKGERPHACPDPECTRRFSRKHDMRRHFQSRHTNMGSPRRQAFMDPTTAFPDTVRAGPIGFTSSFESSSSTVALHAQSPFPTHNSR